MSDLRTGEIISYGLSHGLKNIASIAVNFLLWILTFWIPYLNIGTTIGLFVGIVAKSSREEQISFTEIFDPVYRKQMSSYFLVTGLVSAGTSVGLALFFVPGIVLSIAWMLAPLFAVDAEMGPMEAITRSNSVTHGKKAAIFWAFIVIGLITAVGALVLGLVFGLISRFLSTLVVIVFVAFAMSFIVSAQGYVYSRLKDELP
jgi:hypothetical protein